MNYMKMIYYDYFIIRFIDIYIKKRILFQYSDKIWPWSKIYFFKES